MRSTWSLILLLGCSDDEPSSSDATQGAATSDATRLDGARSDASLPDANPSAPEGDDGACSLVAEVTRRLGAQDASCGTLPLTRTPDDSADLHAAARSCVLAAVANGRPFAVAKQERGIDSIVWTGYLREQPSGPLFRLESDGYGGTILTQQRCSTLSELRPCEPTEYGLCLECASPSELIVLCKPSG